MTIGVTPADILTFWREAGPDQWFADDPAFDLAVRSSFFATHEAGGAAGLQTGSTARKARSRLSSCSISSRATCFAAMRAPLRPMRWPAL